MIVKAHMLAFANGKVREIEVPDAEMVGTAEEKLEKIFYYGQNDFQPRACPSLSAGDVVSLDGAYWLVKPVGWQRLSEQKFKALAAGINWM